MSKESLLSIVMKVKVVLYTFICRGVPVRENTFSEPLVSEVGWPVPFLATSRIINHGSTKRLFSTRLTVQLKRVFVKS